MGLLDGGLAATFGSMFATFYPDGSLHRATITPDGKGGGSTGWAEPEPVKAQLDKTIERMVDGNVEALQAIYVLQRPEGEQIAKPSTDDEITTFDAQRWQIATIEADPAGAYWLLGGRKSAIEAS